MKPKLDQSKYSPLILTGLIVLLGTLPICFCQNNQHNQACRQPFWCGNIKEIGYPFWGGDRPESCGYPGFQLSCRNNTFRLNISSISYRLLDIDSTTQTLKVSRDDLSNTLCPRILLNTTLNSTLFDFSSTANDKNITLYYGCNPSGRPAANQFSCNVNGSNSWGFYFAMETSENNVSLTCSSSIYVPVSQNVARALAGPTIPPKTKLLQDALANGFSIQWSVNNDCHNCVQSGGLCEHNNNNHGPGSFLCYCSDGPHNFTCNDTGYKKRLSHLQKYVIIGVSLGLAVIVLSSLTIFYIAKEYRLRKQDQESNQDINKVLLNHGSLAPKRYKYNEIKKITKSFTDKLGKGGYGIIYKGKLPDGQLVAVKVLTETDDNAQDFINEVSSISQTSHVNIVNLLGFCYERKKRALVYEFMPNKSLDNYISKNRSLEWEKLYEIAVGIARGLEYLHRGCNTRIVHFDIKPQNILLDEDLCPKISDFGLAKLFKKKQSIISMLGMRGTIGYIAPEVFSRNFGVVSHKSDVYSYGMMLLEMAGAKKAVGMEGNQSSEDFFPDKIYERVLLENERLDDFMVEEKEENARKMLLVGVWCIQTNPSDRPSMSKVVEMLEGSVGSIQIPPKPFVSSPVLSPQTSSSYSATLEIENSIKG